MPEPDAEVVADTEAWFLRHGLTYFVPSIRASVRAGLAWRRIIPLLVVVAVIAGAAGFALALLVDQDSAGPALGVSLMVGAALLYALTALHAREIVSWAMQRTFGSLRVLLPMASRALPLLLLFVTFLFVNTEAWQMTSALDWGTLWLTVVILTALAVAFLLVRLPEEVDRVDDAVDPSFIRRTTAGTPVAGAADGLLADGWDPSEHAQVVGYDRSNLILVLLVVQVVQVLLLVVAVFAFFVLFGALTMSTDVQQIWTYDNRVHSLSFLPNASRELLKVSLFLAGFSGLYFTVSAVTDETYRGQFFASVTSELERAVGVRTVYLCLRERRTSS